MHKDKIKVLHILNGADRGGIQSVVFNYYKHIDRTQFQFDFVIPKGKRGPVIPEFEKLGGTFYELPPKGSQPIAYIKELRRLIKCNHYDIVHGHQHSSSYFPLFVAMSCGVKCRVAQCHSYMIDESVATKIKRYIGVVLNDLSSNLRFACTNQAASHLFGKRFRCFFPVTILPNGVEPENFPYSDEARALAREELKIGRDTLVLGVVGRMSSEKNHKYLINVLAELIKLKQDVRLLMVGDGPLRTALEDFAKERCVFEYVIFAGKRPDLVNMLCTMDVFALPSIYEGSPVSAVEAAANGLPLILSSNITKDLNFLKNVEYVDINQSSYEKWARTIIELSMRRRDADAVTNINNNGFNIRDISKLLTNSYLNRLNR